MSEMACIYMPKLNPYLRWDETMVMKAVQAVWYKELTGFLKDHGFRICTLDEEGNNIIHTVYVDDILVLSPLKEDCHLFLWILTDKYKKVAYDSAQKLSYLGMVLNSVKNGYEMFMRSYIEDTLELYK
jgi:hypothetical protein